MSRERAALAEIDAADFFAVDIRVGTVLSCEAFPEARRPAYRMVIDFGPLGTRRSSARLTDLYGGSGWLKSSVVAA